MAPSPQHQQQHGPSNTGNTGISSKTPESSSIEEQDSISSSDDSSWTPTTPPSPAGVVPAAVVPPHTPPSSLLTAVPVPPIPSRYLGGGNVAATTLTLNKSPSSLRSSPGGGAIGRLGAIDEDSEAVSPDLPARSPLRRLGIPDMKRFAIASIPTLYATRRPHEDPYGDVKGPNGEKFQDLRQNLRPEMTRGQRRHAQWCGCSRLLCVVTLVLVVGVALAIGLIVGLKVRNHHNSSNENVNKNSTDSGINAGFPAGQYGVTTYLNDTDTSCVSNAAVWRCPPFTTYAQSPEGSLTTLSWTIAAQSGGAYTISSANPVFSYRFQNISLTKMQSNTDNEYWAFSTQFDKPVIPSAAISASGVTAICYFNDTLLDGRLYTRKPVAAALQSQESNSTSNNAFQSWPYAVEFSETRAAGDTVPQCFEYVNGQVGENLNVNLTVSTTTTTGSVVPDCRCSYMNFF